MAILPLCDNGLVDLRHRGGGHPAGQGRAAVRHWGRGGGKRAGEITNLFHNVVLLA